MDHFLSSDLFQENWFKTILWCLFSGSALLIGSYFGIKDKLSHSWIARVMAFGSGSLLGLISIDMTLMAKQTTGTTNTVIGLLIGASLIGCFPRRVQKSAKDVVSVSNKKQKKRLQAVVSP